MTTLPTNGLGSARGGRLSRLALIAALGLFGVTAAQAQTLNYNSSGFTNTSTTYTDLGTTGTVITTANTDDANSAAQPIGFTFNFNGQAFTDFILNTNGFIKLGTTAPSAANLFYTPELTIGPDAISSTNAANTNLLVPFNVDLQNGATGTAEYRVFTTGAAGSQVTTIQWKNVRDKAMTSAAQYDSFSFQVKLYEGTNNIEFVYNAPTAGATGADAFRLAGIGIKGSGPVAGQDLLVGKTTSAGAWSSATAVTTLTGNYSTFGFNYRRSAPPTAGQTYRFAPISANTVDAGVSVVYTLGQVAQSFATPHAVQAVVTNNGGATLTNLPVTLNVTGASTFTDVQTVASLAAGATTTVTFAAYPLTALGANTVRVSVAATGDANTANDAASTVQTVTADQLSYIAAGTTTYDGGIGLNNTANIVVANKYTISAPAVVTAITPVFVATATANTYQVQLYDATGANGAPGALLYTSPTQNRAAAASSPTITIPATAVSGSFYVAVKQLGTANIAVAYQDEVPGRTGTFFISPDAGTTFIDINTAPNNFDGRVAIGAVLSSPSNPNCPAVTALAVGSITDTGASVSFTPATGASGYTVTYTAAGGTPVTVNATGSPVALTGLTLGTAYTVSVTANCGTGGTSTPATATFTTTGNNCPQVTAAAVTNITSTGGLVTFTGATGAVGYDLTLTPTAGGTPVTGSFPDDEPIPLGNLTPNTSYTITITTICASGSSSVVTVVFSTTPTPPTPANDECAAVVTLTPGAPGAACSPTAGTAYGATESIGAILCAGFTAEAALDVWYQFTATYTEHTITTAGGFDGVLEVLTGTCAAPINFACGDASVQNGETLRLTNLTVGTTYLVRYYPYDGEQTQANSAFTICVTTPANATVCSPVTALSVTGITATSASVNFTPGAGNTGYTVTYTRAGQPAQTVTPAPSASPVLLSGLTPSATYTVSVTPVCAAGGSAPAVTTTFTTPLGTRAALAGGFVSVFPNPAHQSFTVAIPAVSNARSAEVAILNALGQVVRTQAVSLSPNATQATIDAANLAAGIYTVRVKAGSETANVRLSIQ